MMLQGTVLTPLKIIPGDWGSVFHGLKANETTFSTFGEAYFSTVKQGAVKGWKLHTEMICNIVVPVGAIRFVLYDSREESQTRGQFLDVSLSLQNYQRLTVPPGVWLAFQGLTPSENILLNLASIPHDPTEAIQLSLDSEEIPTVEW